MREKGCPNKTCEYVHSLLDSESWGLLRPPFNRGDLRKLYKEGFERGLWHPEYHGVAHFDFKNWVLGLKEGDKDALLCFDLGVVCLSDRMALRSENLMHNTVEQHMELFVRGTETLRRFFGYKPRSHSSPHDLAGQYLLDIASNLGFLGIDSVVEGSTTVLSKFNRMRFDPFASDFEWNKAWGDIRNKLRKEKSIVLAFHAQNTFDKTYSPERHKELLGIFSKTVKSLRKEFPGVIFLTSNELHQIQLRGWSEESWHNSFVYRNYNPQPVSVELKNLKDVNYLSVDWENEELLVEDMNGVIQGKSVKVGDKITLLPNIIYKVSPIKK